jgi:hypothetical protein
MKTIALDSQKDTGAWLLTNVLEEPVLVTLPDGNRYIISHADDLETEVELLRNNQRFISFLEAARSDPERHSLADVRAALATE